MNVINFFKFIEGKKPEYNTEKAILNVKAKGFSTPINSESTVNPENYKMNGWFTNDKLNGDYEDSIRYSRKYIDGEMVDYNVRVDLSTIYGRVFLDAVYTPPNVDLVVRRFKMIGENRTEPYLNEKPRDDVRDFKHLSFQRQKSQDEHFFFNFLSSVFETFSNQDWEWIKETFGDNFKEALESRDIEWLNEMIEESYSEYTGPYQMNSLYRYLSELYGSVAEYMADSANYTFDGDCAGDYGNIVGVTVKWPYATLHLNVGDTIQKETDDIDPVEAEYNSSYDLISPQDIIENHGLRFDVIKKYIEMYPFKLY
jgi:hypothetical protein